jgi:hypothetical protein
MSLCKTLAATALGVLCSMAAWAQQGGSSEVIQRDVNQQQRIEDGLKSGELTTKEAGKLERAEGRIDRLEAKDLSKGPLTPKEQAQINRMEDEVSRDIYSEKHDAQTGNPNSPSAKRMEADVQRNVSQEQRIEQGVKSGALNDKQVGALERGQARVDRMEANAAANGHVGRHEQQRIQRIENHQSKRIWRAKH